MSAPAPDRSSSTVPRITQASFTTPSLEDALRFERLLADLSARFISLAPEEVEGAIEVGLRAIVEALDLDRSTRALCRPEDGAYVVPIVGSYWFHACDWKDTPTFRGPSSASCSEGVRFIA